ncbi:MAG: hypothetical protein IJB30_03600 [Clostridia bacterium]|nr:hypothetical protein [Clostridia bacterium]
MLYTEADPMCCCLPPFSVAALSVWLLSFLKQNISANFLDFQSAFGHMRGESGTIPQGMDTLHDFLPGGGRSRHKKIM